MARKESVIPEAAEETTTTSPGQADGMWTLTLNHKPLPGSNIIVFLPVCEDANKNPVMVSPGTSSAPEAAAPLDISSGNEKLPVCNSALDLSKKCTPSDSIPSLSIKTEPNEPHIVGKREEIPISCTDIESKESTKTSVTASTIAPDTKNVKLMSTETKLPILITDVRTEAPGAEVGAPRSCQQVKKEIKMEVEHRSPA